MSTATEGISTPLGILGAAALLRKLTSEAVVHQFQSRPAEFTAEFDTALQIASARAGVDLRKARIISTRLLSPSDEKKALLTEKFPVPHPNLCSYLDAALSSKSLDQLLLDLHSGAEFKDSAWAKSESRS
jgi:hypothetical protein